MRFRLSLLSAVVGLAAACGGSSSTEPGPVAQKNAPPDETPDNVPTSGCGTNAAPTLGGWTKVPGMITSAFNGIATTKGATLVAVALQDPEDQMGSSMGLYRSTDGATWTRAEAGLPGGSKSMVLRGAGDAVFVSTLNGVFRSTDDGASWKSANAGVENTMLTAFGGQGTELVALGWPKGSSSSQPYRWLNDEERWVSLGELPASAVGSSGTAFLVSRSGGVASDNGVFRSTGGDWTKVPSLGDWGYMFVFAGNVGLTSNGTDLLQSVDDGVTWTALTAPGRMTELLASNGHVYARGAGNVWHSSDQGRTWSALEAPSTMSYVSVRDDVMVGASGEGVLRTRTGDATWANLGGPDVVSPASLVGAKNAVFALGTSPRVSIDGAPWEPVQGFSYGRTVQTVLHVGTEWLAGATVTAEYEAPRLYHSADGRTWAQAAGQLPGDAAHHGVSALALSDGILYAATTSGTLPPPNTKSNPEQVIFGRGVYRSTDGGASWVAINDGLPIVYTGNGGSYQAAARALDVQGKELTVTFNDGTMFGSHDGGDHWAEVTTITASSGRPAKLDMLAHFGGGLLAASATDGTVVWNKDGTFQPFVAGLPQGAVIRHVAMDGGRAFASVDLANGERHLYWATADTAAWAELQSPLPGRVQSITVNGDRLYSAVANDGVWSVPVTVCATVK